MSKHFRASGLNRERGLLEMYEVDPERADALVFGRRTPLGRRGFLRKVGLSTMCIAVGASIPFARYMPSGLIPVAFASEID